MKTKTKKIIELIKNNDNDLYQEIILNRVSEEEILDKEEILNNYFNQDSNADYRIILKITTRGKILEVLEANSDLLIGAERIAKIKKNYLTKFQNEKLYLLDLSKDVKFTKERKEILKLLRDIYEERTEKGYWLQGKFGVGKTFISIAFLNFLASQKNKTVAFIFLPDLQNALLGNNGSDEEKLHKIGVDNFKTADVLLIDDIGAEKNSEWLRNNVLLPILNFREQADKLTIFTSNISQDDYARVLKVKFSKFDELATARLIDRIKALSVPITLEGKNYRH